MFNMLELWFGTFLAEAVLLLIPQLWRFKRQLAVILMVYILIATLWLGSRVGWAGNLALSFLAIYRLGNVGRIVKNRMNNIYLKRTTRRTSMALFLAHPVLIGIVLAAGILGPLKALNYLSILQLLVATVIVMTTLRNIIKLKYKKPESYLSDKELPTVTVAIPARNETIDLQECLRTVLANDYPKLEVIVLDDCSQTRTADIIRSFAQDGVRFVRGEPPADRWLAKNQAYQKLYEHSSGDLILFCGVDVRLGSHAIRSMVNLLHSRHKSMLSVLPVRINSVPSHALIQPMRYWWELALPRRLFNRPAVLSTSWMIARSKLESLGGFAAVSHTILPEAFFARELVKTDNYSFVRSGHELEVRTVKGLNDQYDTAIRRHYPQIRRRPEMALLLTLGNLVFLILPFALLVSSLLWGSPNFWIGLTTCVSLVLAHVLIVNITDPANSLMAIVSLPICAITEMIVGYASMIRYEFFTIKWKDRNICIPVMHVIPRLPKVQD